MIALLETRNGELAREVAELKENSDVKSKQDEITLLKHQNEMFVARMKAVFGDAVVDEAIEGLLTDHPSNLTPVDNAPSSPEKRPAVVASDDNRRIPPAQRRDVPIRVDVSDANDADLCSC